MPFFDRYWWLRLLGALVVLVFAASFEALSFLLGLFTSSSIGSLGDVFRVFWSAIGIIQGILAIGYIAMLIGGVPGARARKHARQAALRGNLDALPPSRFTSDASKAPDVAAQPLELRWRPTKRAKRMLTRFVPIILLLFLIDLTVSLTPLAQSLPADPLATDPAAVAGIVTLAVIPVAIVIGFMVPLLPEIFGRTYGVMANGEGVTRQTPWGRRRRLRWHEMQLLEVVPRRPPLNEPRAFFLYGARRVLRWEDSTHALLGGYTDYTNRTYEPDAITAEEMAQRLQALMDVIAARTSLAPRTCYKQYEPEEAVSSNQVLRELGRVLGPPLFIAGAVFLALALLILMLPATTSPPLNDVSAVALALIGSPLAILAFTSRSVVLTWLRRVAPAPEAEFASAVIPDDSGAVYTLSYGIPPMVWRIIRGIQLLVLVGAAPALLLPLVVVDAVLPHVTLLNGVPRLDSAGGDMLATGLLLLALLDLRLARPLRRARRRRLAWTVRADTEGLHNEAGDTRESLRWDAITDIETVTFDGRPVGYGVRGADRKEMILWPAGFARYRLRVTDGAAISPVALAALVERRTGVKASVREILEAYRSSPVGRS